MRGKLCVAGVVAIMLRIIPAHAGQTVCGSSWFALRSDHPRACGANMLTWIQALCDNGSSPRMRGKRSSRGAAGSSSGIIPAHAGQTPPYQKAHIILSDHPRACGANEVTSSSIMRSRGSSPRMRGKRSPLVCTCKRMRIIPAHAGQTIPGTAYRSRTTDHPRACGANSLIPLAKRTPTILEKFDLHSRSHFANVIMVPNFLTSARNPQFNIAATTIYQNDDIAMHCSNLFYEMRPEISRWIRLDHEAS